MGIIGVPELLLILFLVLILFGAKKVPELAKGLGNALREFRKATKDLESEDEKPAGEPSLSDARLTDSADDKIGEPPYKA